MRLQGPVDMLDELFGHMLAALRFGASQAACQAALEISFQLHPQPLVSFALACHNMRSALLHLLQLSKMLTHASALAEGFIVLVQADLKEVTRILAGAVRKVRSNFPEGLPPLPAVDVDLASLLIPEPPRPLSLDAAGRIREGSESP